jgi:hypothetical protein
LHNHASRSTGLIYPAFVDPRRQNPRLPHTPEDCLFEQ